MWAIVLYNNHVIYCRWRICALSQKLGKMQSLPMRMKMDIEGQLLAQGFWELALLLQQFWVENSVHSVTGLDCVPRAAGGQSAEVYRRHGWRAIRCW